MPTPSIRGKAALFSKYQTIVVDPPWPYTRKTWKKYPWREGRLSGEHGPMLVYPTLELEQIAALPVGELADWDAHLFVWTTQRYLETTPQIIRGWGFTPSCTLAWCKEPHGWGPGGIFQSTLEFLIYARSGRPSPSKQVVPSQWFRWPRSGHSAKPEAFLDLVEENFPGPYLEMFARRNRLGWDTWGDEALEHVELSA